MIRAAIIGAGAISATHARAYARFPDRCRLVAIADIYREKAERKKAELGLEDARVFDDFAKLLADPEIDLVSVCTPPYTHADVACAALEAGKHVLCEKPMASSLEECDRMLAARAASGRTLAIVAQSRFFTPVMALRDVLDSGLAGEVLHGQVESCWWRGHCYYDLWWRGTWEKEGGGCTLNHAVHHIDLFQWLMGSPEEVRAVMTNVAHDNAEVEDLSVAILRYPGGRLAQLTSSVVHHGEEQRIVFQCEKGRLSYPWKPAASRARDNGFPDPDPRLVEALDERFQSFPPLEFEGHAGEIDNVLTAIETGAPALVDGEEGRRTLELIMAIYKAASQDTAVRLPLSPDDPFYTAAGVQERATHFYEKKKSVEDMGNDDITIGSSSNPQE